jgi:DNA-binding transcriptional MerR regulator
LTGEQVHGIVLEPPLTWITYKTVKAMSKQRSGKLYYSIGEISKIADVEPHVLRYWESEFKLLKPKRNRAGRRAYTKRDVQLILTIKKLLHEDRFTLEGAKKYLAQRRKSDGEQMHLPFREYALGDLLQQIRSEMIHVVEILK